MSDRTSNVWILAPPVLVIVTAFAYYAKYHWARTWVDERSPWIKENIGSHLAPLVIEGPADSESFAGAKGAASSSERAAVTSNTGPAGRAPINESPAEPRYSSYVSADGGIDLRRLAADRALWPKTVRLKKPREFPVVVNGKAVGKVEAPTGSEARLVAIQAGKLGIEFHGGGAWVAAEDTDLATRLP